MSWKRNFKKSAQKYEGCFGAVADLIGAGVEPEAAINQVMKQEGINLLKSTFVVYAQVLGYDFGVTATRERKAPVPEGYISVREAGKLIANKYQYPTMAIINRAKKHTESKFKRVSARESIVDRAWFEKQFLSGNKRKPEEPTILLEKKPEIPVEQKPTGNPGTDDVIISRLDPLVKQVLINNARKVNKTLLSVIPEMINKIVKGRIEDITFEV